MIQAEKERRIYYQDIVYSVCALLDNHYGRKPGHGIICGTIAEPSSETQTVLSSALDELTRLKAELAEAGAWLELACGRIKHMRYVIENPESVAAGFGFGETFDWLNANFDKMEAVWKAIDSAMKKDGK